MVDKAERQYTGQMCIAQNVSVGKLVLRYGKEKRWCRMTGNITAIIILLLMWAYYSGKWGDGEGG